MTRNHIRERGGIDGAMIAVILLSFGVVIMGALAGWLYVQYNDQKTNVDAKVSSAVAEAKRKQAEDDDTKFAQREKEPNRQFIGPDDYGRLTFDYPKTWSVYVATNPTQGGDYQAFLNPVEVPPVGGNGNSAQRFALRVLIQNRDMKDVVSQYDSLVQTSKLNSSTFNTNGQAGTRLDGDFSTSVRGAVVIFKIRDKTVSVFTDADTFKPDFENIIKTIKFNQ